MKRGALSLAALVVGATIGWFCGTAEYRSAVTVELVPANPPVIFPGAAGTAPMHEAYLQSMATIARSPRVLAAAMRRPEWQEGLPPDVDPGQLELAEGVATTVLGAGVIEVSCLAANPTLTTLTVNAVADALVEVVSEQASWGVLQRLKALTEQEEHLAAKLAINEADGAPTPDAIREREGLRRMLEMVRARMEHLEDEDAPGPRVQVLSRAASPTEPASSNRPAMAILGALIGLVLGGGTAAGRRG